MMRGPEAGAGCDIDGCWSGTAYSRDGAGNEESSPTAAMLATAGALGGQEGPRLHSLKIQHNRNVSAEAGHCCSAIFLGPTWLWSSDVSAELEHSEHR